MKETNDRHQSQPTACLPEFACIATLFRVKAEVAPAG